MTTNAMLQPIEKDSVRYNRVRTYESFAAALGFGDGVEFTNDSALVVKGIRELANGQWQVLMWDADSGRRARTILASKLEVRR
jgi:hypothetical protein